MGDRLTRRALDAWLKSESNNEWLWCSGLRGFGAHRRDGGKAAFVVQFRVGRGRMAKRRRVVLGEYPVMTVEEGRQQAAEYVSSGWKGNDPVAAKRVLQATQGRRQRDTFKALADTFHAARRVHLKPRSADEYESIWRRFILLEFGNTSVFDAKRRDI